MEIAAKAMLFKPGGKFGDPRGGLNVQMVFGPSF
jgi:hypothetical protein